jgi:hypothetical protein
MRSVLLRSLLVIGAGGLVLAALLYVASTVDARPPAVLEVRLTQPLPDDAQRALITTSLEVVFSETVEMESATAALLFEPAVEGAVSWSGSTMIFTPRDPLELETSYAVSVGDGVRDLAGNEMEEIPPPFEFVTAGRPSLVEAVPTDGSSDVALEEPIALTFSSLMDTASVEAALRLRPSFAHELRWSGELLEIVPTQPLRAGLDYELSIGEEAADVAGVSLAEPIELGFRTVAPGLVTDRLVPADGIEGIAVTSPIAVIFDRPIDPGSVSDGLLTISPDVAGSLEVERLPDESVTDDASGRVLRFTPSGPLPPNTTFEVELAPGVASTSGGRLAGPISWSFTTGAPVIGISNQITFITDRSGVANVWAMNPDGSGKRQLSSELVPVVDYAVAPDGTSFVVADGWRLVYQRADGSDRRSLTDDGLLEFDPTYAPNSQEVAFARADAESGEGLGLWRWEIGGGDASAIELPREIAETPDPSAGNETVGNLRAPRYSPDGGALAFVDLSGRVGMVELASERLTRVAFRAAGAPLWLVDSGALLLSGAQGQQTLSPPAIEAPVLPMDPGPRDDVFRLARSGTSVNETPLGAGSEPMAIAADGTIAYVDAVGALRLTELSDSTSRQPVLSGERVVAAGFAPGEPAMVIVIAAEGERGSIELIDLETRRRMPLAPDGSRPRWLP